MVVDLLDAHGAQAANFALDFVESSAAQKPWIFIESRSSKSCLYPPAFSRTLRQRMADKKILWVQSPDDLGPKVVLHWLESSLCEGVLLHRLDHFGKAVPPAVWGRRWQLACKKTSSHFLWIHEREFPVIGFDLKLQWEPGQVDPLIKKGQHVFEKLKRPAA